MKNILGETSGQDTKKDSTLLNESNYYCAYNPNLHKKKNDGSSYHNTLKVKEYQRP